MIDVLAVMGVTALVFVLVRLAFRRDRKIEKRRRIAAEVAVMYKAYGMVFIPEMLLRYTVGDASGLVVGMLKKFDEWGVDPQKQVDMEVDRVFEAVLKRKLETVEGRNYVQSKLVA